jgi:hypothetical protein
MLRKIILRTPDNRSLGRENFLENSNNKIKDKKDSQSFFYWANTFKKNFLFLQDYILIVFVSWLFQNTFLFYINKWKRLN